MSEQTELPKVAWRVCVNGWGCITFAATKSKAKWIAVKGYWDAYGKNGSWPSTQARRAEIYDKSYLRNDPPRPFTEDWVMKGGY